MLHLTRIYVKGWKMYCQIKIEILKHHFTYLGSVHINTYKTDNRSTYSRYLFSTPKQYLVELVE